MRGNGGDENYNQIKEIGIRNSNKEDGGGGRRAEVERRRERERGRDRPESVGSVSK